MAVEPAAYRVPAEPVLIRLSGGKATTTTATSSGAHQIANARPCYLGEFYAYYDYDCDEVLEGEHKSSREGLWLRAGDSTPDLHTPQQAPFSFRFSVHHADVR